MNSIVYTDMNMCIDVGYRDYILQKVRNTQEGTAGENISKRSNTPEL
jgi:hypothetical protein